MSAIACVQIVTEISPNTPRQAEFRPAELYRRVKYQQIVDAAIRNDYVIETPLKTVAAPGVIIKCGSNLDVSCFAKIVSRTGLPAEEVSIQMRRSVPKGVVGIGIVVHELAEVSKEIHISFFQFELLGETFRTKLRVPNHVRPHERVVHPAAGQCQPFGRAIADIKLSDEYSVIVLGERPVDGCFSGKHARLRFHNRTRRGISAKRHVIRSIGRGCLQPKAEKPVVGEVTREAES